MVSVTRLEIWMVNVGISQNTNVQNLLAVFLPFIRHSFEVGYSSSSLSDNVGKRSDINRRGLDDVVVGNEIAEPRLNLCTKP